MSVERSHTYTDVEKEMSGQIYQKIMSVKSSNRKHSGNHRVVGSAKSTNTHISFAGSACNSAKSRGSASTYSDLDIIRNRSWSASKIRSNHSHLKPEKPAKPTKKPFLELVPAPSVTNSESDGLSTPRPGLKGTKLARSSSRLRTPRVSTVRASTSQPQRLHEEWSSVEQCRAMKRASEMVQHRLDPMYLLSGSNVPLQERYQVNDTELERLREMTETSQMLQHDLRKIKYPNSVRAFRPDRSKAKRKPQEHRPHNSPNEKPSSAECDAEDLTNQTNEAQTSVSEPAQNTGVMPPSSPISTPDATPRPEQEPETGVENDNVVVTEQQESLVEGEEAENGEVASDDNT